jgi:hypothetical protein
VARHGGEVFGLRMMECHEHISQPKKAGERDQDLDVHAHHHG